MILLGAGASKEAGVPATYEMTEKLLELIGRNSVGQNEQHNHVLRFVVGGLLMRRGKNGENPFDGINVEDVFNAIDLLANRENLEADSFIGSWHPLVEELDMIRPPKRFASNLPSTNEQIFVNNRSRDLDRVVADLLAGKRPTQRVG